MTLPELMASALAADLRNPEPLFDEVAAQADPQLLGHGIAAALRGLEPGDALRSAFERLYVRSNAGQQAALVNRLLAAAPETARSAAGGALDLLLAPGGSAVSALQTDAHEPTVMVDPVRPARGRDELSTLQATALLPHEVGQIAAAVVAEAPDVLDELGRYYAQHPVLIKTLGNPALLSILRELQRRLQPAR